MEIHPKVLDIDGDHWKLMKWIADSKHAPQRKSGRVAFDPPWTWMLIFVVVDVVLWNLRAAKRSIQAGVYSLFHNKSFSYFLIFRRPGWPWAGRAAPKQSRGEDLEGFIRNPKDLGGFYKKNEKSRRDLIEFIGFSKDFKWPERFWTGLPARRPLIPLSFFFIFLVFR